MPTTALVLALLLTGCPSPAALDDDDSAAPRDPGPSPYTMDDVLQLPHVQAKGTHNSYHLQPDPVWHPSHRYSHAPLDVQLQDLGVRQLELDLHYRTGSGFEFFHLPLIDEEGTCRALADCLGLVRSWSEAHPWHLPIVIWIEPKGDADSLDPELEPLSGRWDELDAALLEAMGPARVITPDEVRGASDTLSEAIQGRGWPTLGTMRGRVLFALLDGGDPRDEYLLDHPSAEGRVIFPGADRPEDPWAAMFKINDAEAEAARVGDLVTRGFVVTSNAGSADGGEDNPSHWAASLSAGANFLSTDLPGPNPTGWQAEVPDGAPARCNPVSAPPGCTAEEIEALGP